MDLATLKARLAEAEEAEHRLLTGEMEASVTHGDQQVAYHRADAERLAAHIRQLRVQIARLEGRPGRRPILAAF